MIDFQIKIFLGMYDKAVEQAVIQTPFPKDIKGEFLPFKDKKTLIPDHVTVAFLTDRSSLLKQVAALKKKNLFLIYCGHAADVTEYLDQLEALWPAGESLEIVQMRFERLLKHLKDRFDAWFYEHTLLTTIDSIPDMLWYKRIDGIHMLVNHMFTEIVHKSKADVQGKDHFYIWDVPRPAEGSGEFACAESEEIAISTGKTYICDEPVKTHDGMKQFITYKTPVYDMYGNVFGTVGIGHDVTNFSNMGIELSILVENLPLVIFSEDWKVVRMNNTFEEISNAKGTESENFDYHAWKEKALLPVNQGSKDDKQHSRIQECKMICEDGEVRYFIVREQEIRDFFDNISGYFLMMQDITYQRAYERSIIEAANTDMLTGMYNRRYFYNFLSQNAARPMTLLYMDLDHFKAVNDHFGHAKGDEVLIKTSQIIRNLFPGTISARLGGDEFALIIEGNHKTTTEKKCHQLEYEIQNTFSREGLNVTISVGIAETTGNINDIDAFIHEGDTRMYEIKKAHHKIAAEI